MDLQKYMKKEMINVISKQRIKKLNKIIKENVILIPLIYIIGTIIILIRNKIYGLPFSPISIIQFAIIAVYFLLAFFCYLIIKYILIKVIKEKKIKDIFLLILLFILIIEGYNIVFELEFIVGITHFIIMPILMYLLLNKYKKDIINDLIVIFFYMTIVLYIPISMGGFKGQDVYFHNNITNTKEEYTFYGIVDGLYQLSDEDNIYLIPIDKGYIEYKKTNNK